MNDEKEKKTLEETLEEQAARDEASDKGLDTPDIRDPGISIKEATARATAKSNNNAKD